MNANRLINSVPSLSSRSSKPRVLERRALPNGKRAPAFDRDVRGVT